MSEGKWTKGPWFDGVGNDRFIWAGQNGACHALIAVVSGAGPVDDERSANAHLIAAAPELYEALACFLEDERFQTAVGGNPIAVDRMIDRARSALAKARGESS